MRLERFLLLLAVCTCLYSVVLVITQHQENWTLENTQPTKSLPKLAPVRAYTTGPNVDLNRDVCVEEFAFGPKQTPEDSGEARHIAFLKVHKAASSTLFNIFYRFGQQRGLTFIVPRYEHVIGVSTAMRKRKIFPPPGNKTYDLACLHAIFEKEIYEAYLPNDTVYIATVREPLDRFISSINYYRRVYEIPYLSKVPGSNFPHNFLLEPEKYETDDVYYSETNNRMAVDFGYPPSQFKNTSHFKEYLKVLDSRFDIVLDTKLFPESVILMKRKLKWTLRDVLYIKQNRMKKKPTILTKQMKAAARKFLHLDYMLYEHFESRLKVAIGNQDPFFVEEVENLKHVQRYVSAFCSQIGYFDMGWKLVVGESKWNTGFELDFCDCSNMMVKEIPAVQMLQTVTRNELEKYGPNKGFFLSRPK